jgi:DNA processing protein
MPSDKELPALIALTLVPGIGPKTAKALLETYGTAQKFFDAHSPAITHYSKVVDDTLLFMRKFGIKAWGTGDPEYPRLLADCADPPTLLYFKGETDFNRQHLLSIVGTRRPSLYGKQMVRDIVRALVPYDVLIVSGLADGIDGWAHRHALEAGIPTVGVLGHGLDIVYPSANRLLAKSMIRSGGLLTEFRQGTGPETYNFPVRNRIVAGISEATIVIESKVRGGSMLTAMLAHRYQRTVCAVPGRSTDEKSAGCHALIRDQIAHLVCSGEDIAEALNWVPRATPQGPSRTPNLLLDLLRDRDAVHLDELQARSGLTTGELASALLALELDRAIEALPGKRYRLGS